MTKTGQYKGATFINFKEYEKEQARDKIK